MKGLRVTGDVTFNGEIMSGAFFREIAVYVPQEDRLWSALTGTSARAQRPKLDSSETLSTLYLSPCHNRRIDCGAPSPDGLKHVQATLFETIYFTPIFDHISRS